MLQRLQRMAMPFSGYCKGGAGLDMGLSDSDTSSSETTDSQVDSSSTYSTAQDAQYKSLLGGADNYLGMESTDNSAGLDSLYNNLSTSAQGYNDVLANSTDRTGLDAAKMANMDSADISAGRALQGIGVASQGTGTAASARRGIAEGVASADIYSAANADNAALENSWQSTSSANQLAASQGLSGLTDNITTAMDASDANSEQGQYLQNLINYQSLISNDMGGTEDSSQTGTSATTGNSNTQTASFGYNLSF